MGKFIGKLLAVFIICVSMFIAMQSNCFALIVTYNCNSITGGAQRSLDYISIGDLNDGDRAMVYTANNETLFFKYDASGVTTENTSGHPYTVRPDDFVSAGVWVEYRITANSGKVYYVDPDNADSGVTGNGRTIKALATTIGTNERATLYFSNSGSGVTEGYTVTTAIDLSSYPYLNLEFENGAQIDGTGGVTPYSPSNIKAQPGQQIFSGTGNVKFSEPGPTYVTWFPGEDIGEQFNNAIPSASPFSYLYAHFIVPDGNDYVISTPVNFSDLGNNLRLLCDFGNSYILLETTDQPSFDCSGSGGFIFKGGQIESSVTNMASSGFLLGPTAAATNQLQFEFDGVQVVGSYTKATITAIGTAPLILSGRTQLTNNAGTALSLTRRNSGSEVSVYSTLSALPQDSTALWANDRVVLRGGASGIPVVKIEGETNHISFDGTYLRTLVADAPYMDIDCTTENFSENISLTRVRGEYVAEPTNAITITGNHNVRLFISGGKLPASDNIVYAPDVSYLSGQVGWPEPTKFGSGRNLDLYNVSDLFLNFHSGIETVTINGEITNGIFAIGIDSEQAQLQLGSATNPERVFFIDTRNKQYYTLFDDFDKEADGTDIASWNTTFWTRGGTNSADAMVTIENNTNGTVELDTGGLDDDSTYIIGQSIFAVNSNPKLEARFKRSAGGVFIAVGFVEAAFLEKSNIEATCDDFFLVGLDTDDGHGFGGTELVILSDDNGGAGAGGLVEDTGKTNTSGNYVKIKIDLTDTEQPRVWIDDSEVSAASITGTVQAGISYAPFIIVQSLSGAVDTLTVDYIKVWQDR